MTDFIWPSDIDRAESEELARVCDRLEEVEGERDALAAHVEFMRETSGKDWGLEYGAGDWINDMRQAMAGSPTTSLALRDAHMKAEALEAAANNYGAVCESEDAFCRHLYHLAEECRRQAEGESSGQS